jgi:ribosomal peptide maturation radical SAM protein 1
MARFDSLLLRPGEAVIIVPPIAMLRSPSLAAHVLQACARTAGFRVSVLYANLTLAAAIGQKDYDLLSGVQVNALLGERLFTASAYGLPPLGHEPEKMLDVSMMLGVPPDRLDPRLAALLRPSLPFELAKLRRFEAIAKNWVDEMAAFVAGRNFKVVGCTTNFAETTASVALLNRIKQLSPQTITIIGGANCAGEMAEGIASLSPAIDYVFSGESETVFPEFLGQVTAGLLPQARLVHGQPCSNLDVIPDLDYTDFDEQVAHWLPLLAADQQALWLPYETSRGCWWGQKHHCTFCGINGEGLKFRQKSPGRVIKELKKLHSRYPGRRIHMADSLMPFNYFKLLLPRLSAELPSVRILYDQKASLSLADVLALKQAGVDRIVPGIEALSAVLLRQMDKGVSVRQNIALLRYARSARIRVHWLLLWGIPGDRRADYEQTLAMLPLMRHLEPPLNVNYVYFSRFSPYFEQPAAYGLRNLRPWGGYAAILPPGVDPGKVAYYFAADYESDSYHQPELIQQVVREVALWQRAWNFEAPLWGSQALLFRPRLELSRQAADRFELRDTRGLPGTEASTVLDRGQAAALLLARPFARTAEIEWALERRAGLKVDDWYVPLATAQPELLLEFEQEARSVDWSL